MTIKLIAIGKTDNTELQALIDDYQKRLGFYIKFKIDIIPDIKNVKNLSEDQQKQKEGELILKSLKPTDALVLLDENGKQMDSVRFASISSKTYDFRDKAIGFCYWWTLMVFHKKSMIKLKENYRYQK